MDKTQNEENSILKSVFYQLSCIGTWYWRQYIASSSWCLLNDGSNTDSERILSIHFCIKWHFMSEEHKRSLRAIQIDRLPRIIQGVNVYPQQIY